MMQWIRDNDVVEMEDLLVYAAAERREDWWPLLCDSCAYVIGALLKSRRHRRDREQPVPEVRVVRVDAATGQIIGCEARDQQTGTDGAGPSQPVT